MDRSVSSGARGLTGDGIGQIGDSAKDDVINFGRLNPDHFPEKGEGILGGDRYEEDSGDFPDEPDDGGDFVGEFAARGERRFAGAKHTRFGLFLKDVPNSPDEWVNQLGVQGESLPADLLSHVW